MSLVFSVDAETDGLYGPVWAIGAVVLDGDTEVARFEAQTTTEYLRDPWVIENVVPYVDLPQVGGYDLLDNFWYFWESHRESAIAVADCGAPVEAGLFRSAVALALRDREFKAPYPLHDLATLLYARGIDPMISRRAYIKRWDLMPHNPVDDALASGLCWQKAIEMPSKAEFVAGYLQRTAQQIPGQDATEALKYRTAIPCNCDEEECEGWQMVPTGEEP